MAKEKHEDFGEKIGGARKDLYGRNGLNISALDSMTIAERLEYIKKENIWKKPNFKKMQKEGVPRDVLYFINKVWKACPARPLTREGGLYANEEGSPKRCTFYYLTDSNISKGIVQQSLTRFASTMAAIRDAVMDCRSAEDVLRVREELFLNSGLIEEREDPDPRIPGKMVYHTAHTKEWYKDPLLCYHHRQLFYEKSAGEEILSVFPRNEREYEKLVVTEADKEKFLSDEPKLPKGFRLYSRTGKDGEITYSLFGTSRYFSESGFKTEGEAIRRAIEVAAQRRKTRKGIAQAQGIDERDKERPSRPFDWRNGKDVTGEDLIRDFGFKGGEYGNWVSQSERQESLNAAYDAFCDLAYALKIDRKDLSLNGTLSIAFGARGRGNAAAHYEPLRQVINLTKPSGAGSLAHEWFHALDNYVQRERSQVGVSTTKRIYFGTQIGNLLVKNQISPAPNSTEEMNKDLARCLLYKTETLEEAQKRQSDQILHARETCEKRLDNVFLPLLAKMFDKENLTNIYEGCKGALLRGESESADALINFYKNLTGKAPSKILKNNLHWHQDWMENMLYLQMRQAKVRELPSQYYENSVAFAEKYAKNGGYWQSPEEMGARAFAVYIHEALPYRSDYLCGHAFACKGETIDKDGNKKLLTAYPDGDEATRICKGFDRYMRSLKEMDVFQEKDYGEVIKTLPAAKVFKEALQTVAEGRKVPPSDMSPTQESSLPDADHPVPDKGVNSLSEEEQSERSVETSATAPSEKTETDTLDAPAEAPPADKGKGRSVVTDNTSKEMPDSDAFYETDGQGKPKGDLIGEFPIKEETDEPLETPSRFRRHISSQVHR